MNESKQVPVYKQEVKGLQQSMAAMAPAEILAVFDTDAAQLEKQYPNPLKLAVGDTAPLFELPNATGKHVSLKDSVVHGNVVLVFYRGTWCPYCNLSLNAYQRVLEQIKALGANLIAVSPQTPDNSLGIIEKNALAFEVLSDDGNTIISQYTTIVSNPETSTEAAAKLGADLTSFYANKKVEVPIPAVFVINKAGKITFAKSEGGDWMKRVEPQEILDALKATA